MRKHISFGLLVLANILATATILFLAILSDSVRFNPLFNPGFWALAGIAPAQLLILAIVTAFHDPRLPVSRWLSIAAIIFGAGTVFAIVFTSSHLVLQGRFSWYGNNMSATEQFLIMLYVTIAGMAAILAGCMALILMLHIAAWPLRTMLGWRLVREGEQGALANARQFGITHLMAWVGLSAALLWLLKAAAGAGDSLFVFLAVLALVAACVLFVLPWSYLLVRSKIKLWPFIIGFAAIAALSYLAQEATSQFNMYQINNSKSVAGAFLLPSFQMLEYGAFGGSATLAAALNFLMLRRMGFRFQSSKANLPATVAGTPRPNVASPSITPHASPSNS